VKIARQCSYTIPQTNPRRFCRCCPIAKQIQRIALTVSAAVAAGLFVVGLFVVGLFVAVMVRLEVEGTLPLPCVGLDPRDVFGLVTTTLPTELLAKAVAASVAAVERSPATAANEA
jgi:hypothetical protein